MSNHLYGGCHCGRRNSKLLIGTVCASFWLVVTVLYYGVHHFDREQQHLATLHGSELLRRDTRDEVLDYRGETVRDEIVKKRPWTESAQKGAVQEEVSVDKDDDETIPLAEGADLFLFPPCKNGTERFFFDPSILKTGDKLRQFTGRKLVPYVSVYPADNTAFFSKRKRDGNTVISRKVVDKLREDFKAATRYRRDFRDSNVARVERMTLMAGLSFGGRLFLIEIATKDNEESPYHTEYVIESGQGDGICHPIDYVINPDTKIYVIMMVKNLGEWVERLINEFEQLEESSGDGNFELILVDFNSTDIALAHIVHDSNIGHKVKILQMGDTFNKSAGVVTAVDRIQNPDDILFLCDLHLEIPTDFLSDIRKHVIKKKMVFAPVVGRLERGASPDNAQGEWDTNGFSIIALTKADWDMIGGINTKQFEADQLGSEDWEMIDRIVDSGLLVNRRRVPGLLHHYHDKTEVGAGGSRYQSIKGGRGDEKKEKEDSQMGNEGPSREELGHGGLEELRVGPGRERIHSFNATAGKGFGRKAYFITNFRKKL